VNDPKTDPDDISQEDVPPSASDSQGKTDLAAFSDLASSEDGEEDTDLPHPKGSSGGLRSSEILQLITSSLEDDKAFDIITIDLVGKSSISDYMVIATGSSNRQVGAMAEHLQEKLKAAGVSPVQIEGMPQCDWVLVDCIDAIVHLFRPEVRAFYNLEKMWGLQGPAGPAKGPDLSEGE